MAITGEKSLSGPLIKHRLVNKEGNNVSNDKLIHMIADPNTLLLAYELIKSKPGNMTPGTDNQTLDGISKKWIKQASTELRARKYEFVNMRRVYIGKPDGSQRPLTISPPRDKIVQKAIQLVLEPIYEPLFLANSHGFRPNKGCHTALEKVKE
jgi:retron-type reverse transcriptase